MSAPKDYFEMDLKQNAINLLMDKIILKLQSGRPLYVCMDGEY